ncbi:KilA-N domain-containing protein [Tatumella ptyseos]|uniref:KilA-N domain-containing protein n=1 Tax=Tatumella ptyseos TaxID=82987 RepID=UPI0030B898EE
MKQKFIINEVTVCDDVVNRMRINDFHQASGGEKKNNPYEWLRLKQTQELIAQIQKETTVIPVVTVEGRNGGTYVCRELVYSYAMWISPTFHLKVIRTFDYYATSENVPDVRFSEQIQAGILLLESASKLLNLSNSSKLAGFQKLQQFAGIPNIMPSYAVDAPNDAVDGSSRPTKALSYLLKDNGITLSANQVYHQLAKLGVIEQRERASRTGIGRVKKFWSLTAKGCMYGKNITSPANPRETQPHFFETKFPSLLKLLETIH